MYRWLVGCRLFGSTALGDASESDAGSVVDSEDDDKSDEDPEEDDCADEDEEVEVEEAESERFLFLSTVRHP